MSITICDSLTQLKYVDTSKKCGLPAFPVSYLFLRYFSKTYSIRNYFDYRLPVAIFPFIPHRSDIFDVSMKGIFKRKDF